jgi:hypothetical protein
MPNRTSFGSQAKGKGDEKQRIGTTHDTKPTQPRRWPRHHFHRLCRPLLLRIEKQTQHRRPPAGGRAWRSDYPLASESAVRASPDSPPPSGVTAAATLDAGPGERRDGDPRHTDDDRVRPQVGPSAPVRSRQASARPNASGVPRTPSRANEGIAEGVAAVKPPHPRSTAPRRPGPHEASTRGLSVGTAGRPVLLARSARRSVGTAREADLRRARAPRLAAAQRRTVSRQARQRVHLLRSGHLDFLDLHCPQGLLAGRRLHGIGALSRGRSRRQRKSQAKQAARHHRLNAATGASSPFHPSTTKRLHRADARHAQELHRVREGVRADRHGRSCPGAGSHGASSGGDRVERDRRRRCPRTAQQEGLIRSQSRPGDLKAARMQRRTVRVPCGLPVRTAQPSSGVDPRGRVRSTAYRPKWRPRQDRGDRLIPDALASRQKELNCFLGGGCER